MALDFKMRESNDTSALNLPYIAEGSNQGFIDLRGKPDLARKIVEAGPSPALTELLVGLAAPESLFFSVGCDLGTYHADGAADIYHAGGYIQVAFARLHSDALNFAKHEAAGSALEEHLTTCTVANAWSVEVIIDAIGTRSLGGPHQTWCLVIRFDVSAASAEAAFVSCESLIGAFSRFFQQSD